MISDLTGDAQAKIQALSQALLESLGTLQVSGLRRCVLHRVRPAKYSSFRPCSTIEARRKPSYDRQGKRRQGIQRSLRRRFGQGQGSLAEDSGNCLLRLGTSLRSSDSCVSIAVSETYRLTLSPSTSYRLSSSLSSILPRRSSMLPKRKPRVPLPRFVQPEIIRRSD